jgi:hypothetical protein
MARGEWRVLFEKLQIGASAASEKSDILVGMVRNVNKDV